MANKYLKFARGTTGSACEKLVFLLMWINVLIECILYYKLTHMNHEHILLQNSLLGVKPFFCVKKI